MESEWVDFREIKRTVLIKSVLARYNIQLRRVNQHSLRGPCPLPTHTSKGEQSFGVHTGKNAWACQSASCIKARGGRRGGNILDLVAVMEGCSIRDAAIKIVAWFNVTTDGKGASPPNHTQLTTATQLVSEIKKGEGKVTDDILADAENKPLRFALRVDHSHPYLTARGITPETITHFGVGFFSGRGLMSGRVVIPICNTAGELVAYAGRSIDGSEPRYKLPSGFKKTLELYNLHRVQALGEKEREQVIVVEGFFDCMRVHQLGYPAAVALMGSSMSAQQEELLAQFSRVVLMLDGDEVGREAASVIAAKLVHRAFVKVVHLPDAKQPDELSSEELTRILGSI